MTPMPSDPSIASSPWRHPPAIGLILLFLWMALSIAATKGVTSDEPFHIVSGYSYWLLNQYRMQPENGNLPQRLIGLPLWLGRPAFPSLSSTEWKISAVDPFSRAFFHDLGNDPHRLVMSGRYAVAIITALLLAAIYLLALRLIGWGGAMIALFGAAFCPLMLSHGALATSDTCAALFFLLAVMSLWRLMHEMNWKTIAAAALAAGGLAISKFSAPLILPMAALMLVIRLIGRRPLRIGDREFHERSRQLTRIIAGLMIVAIGAWLIIWAAYGFRYATFTPEQKALGERFLPDWPILMEISTPFMRLVKRINDLHLLPESYCYGQIHTLRAASQRIAYAAGEFSAGGWWWYFPYALAVKTPIAAGLLWLVGAGCLLIHRRLRPSLYAFTPLIVLLLVYFASAMAGSLNIGLRHLLPIYPALFIVGGCAVHLMRLRKVKIALAALLLGVAAESWLSRPDYLAFFNVLAGGPRQGYKHLADSNLDWGQDLPLIKRWIEDRQKLEPRTPIYLSCFGPAEWSFYRIPARPLYCFPPARADENLPAIPRLEPGYYCYSANMYLGLYHAIRGPWNARWETNYHKAEELIDQLNTLTKPGEAYRNMVALIGVKDLATADALRQGRLAALLRHKEPVARPSPAYFVFKVTAEDLMRAAKGPPSEMRVNSLMHW